MLLIYEGILTSRHKKPQWPNGCTPVAAPAR